jgi:hypothetical protein
VTWSGADEAGGSGIATYDVYVSDNGGPFTRWQSATTATSAVFNAQIGHTYGFYSVATDAVGLRQPTPTAAQTTTLVQTQAGTSATLASDHAAGSVYGQAITLTATVSTAPPGASTPTGRVQFRVDNADFGSPIVLSAGTATLITTALPAGLHTITAVYTSDSPGFAGSATPTPVSQSVAPAPLTVTAGDQSRLYGSTNPSFTIGYSGFVLDEGSTVLGGTLSFTTAATPASHVGTYLITPGGLTAANYALTFVGGTLTVTPAPLRITVFNPSKVYGAPLPALIASYSGFLNGDTEASLATPPILATAAQAASPVGSYPITVGGAASPDYTITYVGAMLTVTPVHLTVSTDNKTKANGAPVPALTYTLTGFVNGETPATSGVTGSPFLTTLATAASPPGSYPITIAPGTLAATNYDFAGFLPGTLTVRPSPEALFVTALYHDLLRRDPESAGLDFWVGMLAAGAGRGQVAQGIYESAEHRGLQVDGFYVTYLHRAADPGERALWVQALLGGASETDVAVGFLTSEEYRQAHPDATSFVEGLYGDILGRTADSVGLAVWSPLAESTAGQAAVARGILTSVEGDLRLLDAYFSTYLHRAIDSSGQQAWLMLLQTGADTPTWVAEGILASDEFFTRVGGGTL